MDDAHAVTKAVFSDTTSVKVLIIEDEAAHFHLMKRTIQKELPQASVYHFLNAAECLEEFDKINPDIILVDYLLPAMNGLEFLSAAKQTQMDIPVVMITGQGNEDVAVHAMKLGAQDYLVKNAEFFSLLPSVIEQVVRERRLAYNLSKASRLNELLLNSLPYPAMIIQRDHHVLAANQTARKMGARVGEICWKTFRFDAHSDDPQKGKRKCTFCRKKDMFQQNTAINIPELTIDGRIWDIWWIPIDSDVFLHYAIDITDRKKAEHKLLISSKFLEIANQYEQLDLLLKAFVHELKNIMGCCITASWIFNHQEGSPFIISEGCDPQQLESVATLTGMNKTEIPAIHHVSEHNFDIANLSLTQLIPICLKERILGFIFLADTKKKRLSPDEMDIATTTAMRLAISVERIQSRKLLESSEQTLRFLSDQLITAQEKERKKISRELHDSIGSSLAAIRLLLQNALHGRGKLKREPLKNILSLTSSTINEVRRIISDLRPSFIDELGIIASLNRFCDQFTEIHPGIEIQQQIEIEEQEIPKSLKIVIFRIVQESCNNIAKYSQASMVKLELIKQKNAIRLSVIDDGIGFNPNLVEYKKGLGTGIGLVSMKERTELSGGTFALNSREGKGTTITASWPLC